MDDNWVRIETIKKKMQLFNINFDILRNFNTLSGSEKVKVILSSIINKNTNYLILDKPTNNMDLDSIKVLENILNQYCGALVVISHDEVFKENVKIKLIRL